MVPSLVAIGTYTLLAWNEYLYAFLMLSREQNITLPAAIGALEHPDGHRDLYSLPPAAICYAFRRYMAAGITAGAMKA